MEIIFENKDIAMKKSERTIENKGIFIFLSFFLMLFLSVCLFSENMIVFADEKAVVKCSEKEFDSLEEALDSADSGSTIVFLKDVSVEPESLHITQDITLDLNGNILSAENEHQKKQQYLLTQNAGNLIIRNGKLIGEDLMGISAEGKSVLALENVEIITTGRALNIRDNAKVTIDRFSKLVTEGESSTIMIISQYDGMDWGKRPCLEVGGTVISQTERPAISGHINDSGRTHITIDKGADIQSLGTAVFQPQNGTLTINEAKISGRSGIEIRQGILTVNEGAEITGMDDSGYLSDSESLDPCTTSAAVTIAEKPRKNQIRVYINGGTFVGDVALCSLKMADTAKTRRTNRTKKEKKPLTAYVRVENGIFDGDIIDEAGCFYGITKCGKFKTNPAWQVKGFTLQIYEFTEKKSGWFYVGEAAQKRLEIADPGTKIDLVNCGDLQNVKSGLILVNKQVWDVRVNDKQVVTNGRNITVE